MTKDDQRRQKAPPAGAWPGILAEPGPQPAALLRGRPADPQTARSVDASSCGFLTAAPSGPRRRPLVEPAAGREKRRRKKKKRRKKKLPKTSSSSSRCSVRHWVHVHTLVFPFFLRVRGPRVRGRFSCTRCSLENLERAPRYRQFVIWCLGRLSTGLLGNDLGNVCVFSVLGMAVDTSTRPYAVFHSISTHWFRARRVFALFALGIIVIVSTCPVSGNLSGVSRRLKSARKLDFLGDDFQRFHILGCLVRQWIRMRQSWGPVEFLRAARCLTTASLPFVRAQCARSAFLVLDHGALAVGYGTARGNLGISSFSRPRHRPAPLTKSIFLHCLLHFPTLSETGA